MMLGTIQARVRINPEAIVETFDLDATVFQAYESELLFKYFSFRLKFDLFNIGYNDPE